MATVSVSSHFGTQEKKICHYFQFSPFNLSWSDGIQGLDLRFYILSFMPTFSLFSLTLSEAMNNTMQGHPRQMNHTEELWESITPLEEGMASNYSILVERTPWTVWKGKKIWGHKMSTAAPPPPHQPWSEDVQYTTGEEQRRIIYSSRKNRADGPKQSWCSVVNVSGGESKAWCCKRLKVKKEVVSGGWDGWMVSLIQWTGIWATLGDSEG